MFEKKLRPGEGFEVARGKPVKKITVEDLTPSQREDLEKAERESRPRPYHVGDAHRERRTEEHWSNKI